MRTQTVQRLGMLFVVLLAWSGVASAQDGWLQAPTPRRSFKAGGIALQLTDGTIMVQEYGTSNWWKLTPDNHADYTTGTWSELAHSRWYKADGTLVNYAPLDFASAVLPDGRVIVEGGEYDWPNGNAPSGKRTKHLNNVGAIFDPRIPTGPLSWTPVDPPEWTAVSPKGLKHIGDAPSVVLPDGTFMLGNIYSLGQVALLDANTLKWNVVNPTGKKYDWNDEEGWTLLPDGNVLTVDADINVNVALPTLPNHSEIFTPVTNLITGKVTGGGWTSAGSTMAPLVLIHNDQGKDCPGPNEIGPAILRPDGTVFATGSNHCKGSSAGPGHTAIYYPDIGFWTKGEDIPCEGTGDAKVCNDMADAPAALLQDGNVLVQTSPGINKGPSTFYEFDLNTNRFSPPVHAPPNFSGGSSEPGRMLVVSSGHVFYMHVNKPTDEMGFYVNGGTYNPAWAPIITQVTDDGTCLVPGCITRGQTYIVSGTQLNGLSGGAAYGDDAQSASNYPLVLIENCATGDKYFARTHDFSTMGVATGFFNVVTAKFTVSPSTELGNSSLIVIANGIPSQPFEAGCKNGGGGFFTVYSEPAGD
jgi:hypothetical protein